MYIDEILQYEYNTVVKEHGVDLSTTNTIYRVHDRSLLYTHNVQSKITIKPLRRIIAITASPHDTDFSNRRLLHQHERPIVFPMLG